MINLLLSICLIFMPLIFNSPDYFKGIAVNDTYFENLDIQLLNATWYYEYKTCSSSICVPMSYEGEDPNLPTNYSGYILFLNEPDNASQHSGTIITAQDAVNMYNQLKNKYHYAQFVVGNVMSGGGTWLIQFKNLCQCSPIWGIHNYINDWGVTLSQSEQNLIAFHNQTGGFYWITEWADVTGNFTNDDLFISWMESQSWIQRAAYYTNRAQGNESWYPVGWKVELINWGTDNLTPIGQWFVNVR